MNDDINPDNLPQFAMPQSIIEKVYEFTGSSEDNKGFVMFFVDQSGNPQVISSCKSTIIEMGIIKAAEEFIEQYSLAPDANPGEQD